MLLVLDAEVDVRSAGGRRLVPIGDFIVAEGSTVLQPGELIAGVVVPADAGPQRFLKLGNRSSVISAVVAAAVALDVEQRRVRLAVGSADGVPQRLTAVEDAASAAVDWDRGTVPDDTLVPLRRQIAGACRARTDHRGDARFRRHAAGVLAARGLASAAAELAGRPHAAGGSGRWPA